MLWYLLLKKIFFSEWILVSRSQKNLQREFLLLMLLIQSIRKNFIAQNLSHTHTHTHTHTTTHTHTHTHKEWERDTHTHTHTHTKRETHTHTHTHSHTHKQTNKQAFFQELLTLIGYTYLQSLKKKFAQKKFSYFSDRKTCFFDFCFSFKTKSQYYQTSFFLFFLIFVLSLSVE